MFVYRYFSLFCLMVLTASIWLSYLQWIPLAVFFWGGVSGFLWVVVFKKWRLGLLWLLFVYGFLVVFLFVKNYEGYHQKFVVFDREELTVSGRVEYVQPLENGMRLKLALDRTYLYVYSKEKAEFQYGDLILATGTFRVPQGRRNPGGMDSASYLKQRNIQGALYCDSLEKVGETWGNPLRFLLSRVKSYLISHHSQYLKPPYSGLLLAILLGDQGVYISRWVESLFDETGLTHALVVSGSQVALLSGFVFMCLRRFVRSFKIQFFILFLVNIFFYFMTGGGASIFRAVVMNVVLVFFNLFYRRVRVGQVFVFVMMVMLLINPLSLFDLGAHLSFLAAFSMVYGVPYFTEKFQRYMPVSLAYLCSLSLAPFLFTLPVTLWQFHTLSFIQIVSNFCVVTMVEIAVFLGFISSLLGPLFSVVSLVLDQIIYLVFYYFLALLKWLSLIPFSQVYVHRETVLLWAIGVFLMAVVWRHRQYVWPICLSYVCFLMVFFLQEKPLLVVFLDVGQGDSVYIQTPGGYHCLIDTGKKYGLVDKGRTVVSPALKYYGVNRLDYVFITHQDLDHIGGLETVQSVHAIQRLVNGEMLAGDSIHFPDGVVIRCLYPTRTLEDGTSKNNQSLVLRLDYAGRSFLFTGDLESEGEYQLLSQYKDLIDVDILKLGHHGSKTSSVAPFLKAVSPAVGVVSAGQHNPYGHPHVSVVKRAQLMAISLFRTDQHGAIVFKVFKDKMRMKTFLK